MSDKKQPDFVLYAVEQSDKGQEQKSNQPWVKIGAAWMSEKEGTKYLTCKLSALPASGYTIVGKEPKEPAKEPPEAQ